MRRNHKIFAILMAGLLLTGCAAGAIEDVATEKEQDQIVEETENANDAQQAESLSEQTEFAVPASCYLDARTAPEAHSTVRGLGATELVAEMKVGWNLGNTMDALGGETAWGNPTVTQEMIDALADKGFNTIRIPTSWGQFTEGASGDYMVKTEWITRVGEVVDYALAKDMYVILNTHHETEWLVPNADKVGDGTEKFTCIWTQIATYFADYGDHLIFEGLNEPREVGVNSEWIGGTEENRSMIADWERIFVETVRATGGNNANRLLLVTGEAACMMDDALKDIYIPENDPCLGVSLHAYTPYDFTFKHTGDYDTWDGSHLSDIQWTFSQADKYFLSKGIPVVMTEYGAERKGPAEDNNDAEVCKWITDYLTIAQEHNVPTVLWDNGITDGNGERFGYLNRRELTWDRESIIDAMMAVIYADR